MGAVFGFLDAGASSSSSLASALVRLDRALLAGLVAFDAASVFALDAGLEEAVPSVVESGFAAADVPREASLVLDLTALVVAGSGVVVESVLVGAAFFLGGMIVALRGDWGCCSVGGEW